MMNHGARTMKVLLIDDDEDIRSLGQWCLEEVGQFETTVAASAREGIDLAEANQPDVILLDMIMPEMDGLAALTELSRSPYLKDIPVILLTASVQPAESSSYLEKGAIGVISKPFDPMQLPAEIREIIGAVDQ